jgi:hypothetical protein
MKDELSHLDEELLFLFFQLPDTQKHIAIEYLRKQVEITNKAIEKMIADRFIESKLLTNNYC